MEIGSFPPCSSQKLRAWGMKAQEMRGLATPASQSPGCGEELRASKVREDLGYPWSGVGVNPASTQHSCIPSTWLQAGPASAPDASPTGIRGRTQGCPSPRLGGAMGRLLTCRSPEQEPGPGRTFADRRPVLHAARAASVEAGPGL